MIICRKCGTLIKENDNDTSPVEQKKKGKRNIALPIVACGLALTLFGSVAGCSNNIDKPNEITEDATTLSTTIVTTQNTTSIKPTPIPTVTPVPTIDSSLPTNEQGLEAITNYLIKNDSTLKKKISAKDGNMFLGIDTASSNPERIVIVYKSDKGEQFRYYIDRASGETYCMKYNPDTGFDDRFGNAFNAWKFANAKTTESVTTKSSTTKGTTSSKAAKQKKISIKKVSSSKFRKAIYSTFDKKLIEEDIKGHKVNWYFKGKKNGYYYEGLGRNPYDIKIYVYDSKEEARKAFKQTYTLLVDAIESRDFKGKGKYSYSKTEGYVFLDGYNPGDGDAYLGVYFKDNTIVDVRMYQDKKSLKDKIDTFLKKIGLPAPSKYLK